MCHHHPRCEAAPVPDRQAARMVASAGGAARTDRRRPAAVARQARENRAHVRALLREREPEFAAMLEFAVAELLARERGAA